MKLISFSAEEVFGHMNFRIQFNDSLTFLVGPNGCGKTTIIRLIRALFYPRVAPFNAIPHRSAQVIFRDLSGKEITIRSKTKERSIDISISTLPNVHLSVPKYGSDFSIAANDKTDLEEEFYAASIGNPIYRYLLEISKPVIMGLERRVQSIRSQRESSSRPYFINDPEYRRNRTRLGSVSLAESQELVFRSYSRIREAEDRLNSSLREQIILSSFQYVSTEDILSKSPDQWNHSEILARRRDIESAVSNIGAGKEKLQSVMNDFFERLTLLSTKTGTVKDSFSIEWLANKAQIDRIFTLAKMLDQHGDSLKRILRPMNDLILTINSFFNDSRKQLMVGPIGELFISHRNGVRTGVDALSSGETQLLILFIHLVFNETGSFIVDEPELSLHLKWQEMLVSAMVAIGSTSQMILATHSPEIIAEKEQLCVEV